MATYRNLAPGRIQRAWLKINDNDSANVFYCPWDVVVGAVDGGTSITLRMPVDSPGQGNQTDPVVIDITDPADVAAVREMLDAAWNLEIEGAF